MATAKKGFGLPCPPPEDDNMGYIDIRSKSGLCPIRQGYTISCNPRRQKGFTTNGWEN